MLKFCISIIVSRSELGGAGNALTMQNWTFCSVSDWPGRGLLWLTEQWSWSCETLNLAGLNAFPISPMYKCEICGVDLYMLLSLFIFLVSFCIKLEAGWLFEHPIRGVFFLGGGFNPIRIANCWPKSRGYLTQHYSEWRWGIVWLMSSLSPDVPIFQDSLSLMWESIQLCDFPMYIPNGIECLTCEARFGWHERLRNDKLCKNSRQICLRRICKQSLFILFSNGNILSLVVQSAHLWVIVSLSVVQVKT